MDLALDPVKVNTELAEDYLKAYNNFSSWPKPGKFWHVNKYPDNKVEYDISEFKKFSLKQDMVQPIVPSMQMKLVEKLQENESLFCQLEYLGRNIDETDVKSNLVLIRQHLQCDVDSWNYDRKLNLVIIKESTPLYILGSVAALKSCKTQVAILSSQKTAPICHLFTDLCAQVGWNLPLLFISDTEKIDNKYCFNKNAEYACTGVVTESADIDSALDVFIESTVKAPWKLESILVQESVYEEVRGALAARCGRAGAGGELAAAGKVFAVDGLGGAGAGVPLEAYRTARELCALLRQRASPALSVWAADSQLAHELALAAPASSVWINDYGSFHGPPAAALPLYQQCLCIVLDVGESAVEALRKRWVAWKKLSKIERVKSILEQFETISVGPNGMSVNDLQSFVTNVRDHSFVCVDSGKICFGVEEPADFENIIHFNDTNRATIESSLAAVVNGAPLLNIHTQTRPQILDALEKAGAPVLWDHNDQTGRLTQLKHSYIRKKIKVIRSNYGTIFAN